jgi:hypothetical protein
VTAQTTHHPRKVNVLWLSRHKMTKDQEADLRKELSISALYEEEDEPPEYNIVHLNVCFAARSEAAIQDILELCEEHSSHVITGVFPAHVALELYRRIKNVPTPRGELPYILVPVSVPAPAAEGEVRGGGFTHSHWEMFFLEYF